MDPMMKLWILLALFGGEVATFLVLSRRLRGKPQTLSILAAAQVMSLILVGVVLFVVVQ